MCEVGVKIALGLLPTSDCQWLPVYDPMKRWITRVGGSSAASGTELEYGHNNADSDIGYLTHLWLYSKIHRGEVDTYLSESSLHPNGRHAAM